MGEKHCRGSQIRTPEEPSPFPKLTASRHGVVSTGQAGDLPDVTSGRAIYPVSKLLSGRADLNRRPHGPEPCVLPTELRPVFCIVRKL